MRWRLITGSILALVAACGSGDSIEITDIRERPSSLRDRGRPATTAERFGFNRPATNPHGAGGSAQGSGSPFAWQLPEGWEQLPATRLRLGNFRIADDHATECYLSVLPGSGGGVVANLNRWRKQMGLPEMEPARIKELERRPLLGQPAYFVDLKGTFTGMGGPEREGYRMVGLILELPGQTAFVKMAGPEQTVTEELNRFVTFAASIRLTSGHGGGGAHGGATSIERSEAPGGLAWTVPKGWVELPKKSMRVVSLAPEGSSDTQCYVAVLNGDAGGVLANINRWRRQMGQAPLRTLDELETLEIFGRRATLVEVEGVYTGMGETRVEKAALLGLVCPLDGRVLFVKMTGPAPVIHRERQKFIEFCLSLRSAS